jgi:hypothetical protein
MRTPRAPRLLRLHTHSTCTHPWIRIVLISRGSAGGFCLQTRLRMTSFSKRNWRKACQSETTLTRLDIPRVRVTVLWVMCLRIVRNVSQAAVVVHFGQSTTELEVRRGLYLRGHVAGAHAASVGTDPNLDVRPATNDQIRMRSQPRKGNTPTIQRPSHFGLRQLLIVAPSHSPSHALTCSLASPRT